MDTEKYFRKLGYDLANGYDSIKLLRVIPEEIHFYHSLTKKEIREYVTLNRVDSAQWDYQVTNEIDKFLIPSKLDFHAYLRKFNQLKEYTIEGYCDAIYNLIGDDNE